MQPLSKVGKLNPSLPVLDGHIGAVLDFDFDPFHSNLIATGGDDCTAKLWQIPEGGLTNNIMDPLVDMKGHVKVCDVSQWRLQGGCGGDNAATCTARKSS